MDMNPGIAGVPRLPWESREKYNAVICVMLIHMTDLFSGLRDLFINRILFRQAQDACDPRRCTGLQTRFTICANIVAWRE